VRRIIIFLFYLLFLTGAARAQELFLSDSLDKVLNNIPDTQHDSFYFEQGKYYYSMHTRQGYHQAMECYLQSLKLALKYDHQEMIAKGYFGVGSVYDANSNIENALKYYTLHYDRILKLYPNDDLRLIRALYNLAMTYAKGYYNAECYIYIKKMEDILTNITDEYYRARYHLLITHLLGKLGDKASFYKYYQSLPTHITFSDSDLAYGRAYAEAKSLYYTYEHKPDLAKKALIDELGRTNDSIPILLTIINKLAEYKDFESAYQYQILLNRVTTRSLNEALYADIHYQLLEADNMLKEQDNKKLLEKEKQLNRRSAVLYIVTFLLAGALILTWFAFDKMKKHHALTKAQNAQIKKQNATNELMLKEIHHRVKNNLQIISSLIELELTKPSSVHYFAIQEIQIKIRSIALAHQMMYEDLDFRNIDLQIYVEKLVNISLDVLNIDRNDIRTNIQMNDSKLNLDKLVPLALALNEMTINTIKHALPHKRPCTISIVCTQENSKFVILYSDNGPGLPFTDLTKAAGTGIRLLRKLAQQMQASISLTPTVDQKMQYSLIFENN
jgi:two-component sensor histidine kinase